MNRTVVLLSDGTGNAASAIWRTNVRRLFEALDLQSNGQVAYYDDGVGTSAFRPLALLGGAFGFGLKRNVLDLYKFACRNYLSDEDKLFGFGFSRGAFTIRVTAGLILNQGLVRFSSEAELAAKAKLAYRAYRRERYHSRLRLEGIFRWFRDLFTKADAYSKEENQQVRQIRFLGVWDTVAAYGLPIDEMTRGVSQWIWPLELPDRRLSNRVTRACHALAIDDERTTFHPVLWSEEDEKPAAPGADGGRWVKDERISQVWFVGAHANVGGGYPDDSLAFIPLLWMMKEAQLCGLRYKVAPGADPDALVNAASMRDKEGRQYDPRQGVGGYYRYGPRKIADLCDMLFSRKPDDNVKIQVPKIHESAFKRIQAKVQLYAPIGLPATYDVVSDAGEILSLSNNPYETKTQAAARAGNQEHIWNFVWARRLVYFLTIFATGYLVIYPLIRVPLPAEETETWLRPISDLIRILGAFLPGAFNFWINAYARTPEHLLLAAGFVAGFMLLGIHLGGKIRSGMESLWTKPQPTQTKGSDWLFRMRTSKPYQGMLRLWKWYIGPALFAAIAVYFPLALFSHVAFNFEDSFGWVCVEQPARVLATGELHEFTFSTNALCAHSGIMLEQGARYRITVAADTPWQDGEIGTSAKGFYTTDVVWPDKLKFMLAAPLRRNYFRPWFRVIAHIGSTGTEEQFLDPQPDLPQDQTLSEVFRASRDGHLFFYVNDAVLPIPGLWDVFYANNQGTAKVAIQRR